MKKVIIIAIAVMAVLLASCNIDATDGIYSEAASSTESTAVTLRTYLGQDNTGRYHYLTDEGIFLIGKTDALFANTNDSIIRSACLLDDGSLLILRQSTDITKGSTLTYNEYENGSYKDAVVINGNYADLLTNGLFYNSIGVYRYSGSGSEATALEGLSELKDVKAVVTGDYAFFEVKDSNGDYRAFVADSDGTVVSGLPCTSTDPDNPMLQNPTLVGGFQTVDDQNFLVLYRRPTDSKLAVFRMSNTGVETKPAITPDFTGTEACSFIYDGYVYVKDTTSFKKFKADGTGEAEQVTTGFATNLRTAEITNILPAKDESGQEIAGVFIAGTKSSMLYRIDMIANESTQIKNSN